MAQSLLQWAREMSGENPLKLALALVFIALILLLMVFKALGDRRMGTHYGVGGPSR